MPGSTASLPPSGTTAYRVGAVGQTPPRGDAVGPVPQLGKDITVTSSWPPTTWIREYPPAMPMTGCQVLAVRVGTVAVGPELAATMPENPNNSEYVFHGGGNLYFLVDFQEASARPPRRRA